MVMIPMECPKCGRRGTVPSNRLNTGFNCKSCNAPFYLNAAGDSILGEPPGERAAVAARQKEATKKKTEDGFEFDLKGKVRELGEINKAPLLGGILGVAAILAVVYWFVGAPSVNPIVERAIYVAKAVADSDDVRIKAAASSETADDAGLWIAQARAVNKIRGNSRDYSIAAGVLDGAGSNSTASVVATLSRLSQSSPSSSSAGPTTSSDDQFVSLPMTFVKDSSGQWRLDGRQTLENTAKAKADATAAAK
jgi:hypothetical protein